MWELVSRKPDITVSEISEKLDMYRVRVWHILKFLEHAGYICRPLRGQKAVRVTVPMMAFDGSAVKFIPGKRPAPSVQKGSRYVFRRRGKPDPVDVGIFMFFAWPILLVIGAISLVFSILGRLFDQPWFCVVLAIGLLLALVFLCRWSW